MVLCSFLKNLDDYFDFNNNSKLKYFCHGFTGKNGGIFAIMIKKSKPISRILLFIFQWIPIIYLNH